MTLADYVNEKPTIVTERLRLRPMNPEDIPSLMEWMPDKSVYTYWGKGPSKAEKDPSLMFEKPERPAKSFHLGIEETSSGKVIGDIWVYLIENDRMASVAVRLAPSCQGRGYGTEALGAMTGFCFEHTELKRLAAEVDVRNIPSVRMLEKCGYTREGLVRQGKMVSTWCDYYIYGILSSDPLPGTEVRDGSEGAAEGRI
ncbi:MAG: GNAT family N-acetyltransferase [Eubacteriaceae bacterium]|nr:GNAT family N-acetyltransferase [Eubacteriaceae bacterium]